MAEFRAIPAVGHVLRSSFGNLGFAFRVSWPWMAFVLLIQILTIFLFPNLQQDIANEVVDPTDVLPQFLTVLGVMLIASSIAFSSIAVNWHRFILLDEEAEGWDRLRLDGVVMRYLGNAFLAQLIAGVIGFVAFFVVGIVAFFLSVVLPEAIASLIGGLLIAAVILWIIAVAMRVAIKLPAIAVENTGFGFGDAWSQSKGYNVRLIGFAIMLWLACALLLALMAAPAYALGLFSESREVTAQILFALFQYALNWIAVIVGVSSLSTLYGVFGEGREL